MNRPLVLIAALAVGAFGLAAPASAGTVTIFDEAFDGARYGAGGVPTAPQASETWYGGRFEGGSGSIAGDMGVTRSVLSTSGYYAWFDDDAGVLFNVSTAGYTDVTLSFDWRTFSAFSNDRFVASYYVGDITEFGSGNTADLRNNTSGAVSKSDFTTLLRNRKNSWTSESFTRSAWDDQSSIWFAFWLDNGDHDYGLLDNVVLDATPAVPLPPAGWLGLALLAGLGAARNLRRRRASDGEI